MKIRGMVSGAVIAAGMMSASPAFATGEILTGDFLQVSVNDQAGTFGQGGGTRPAYIHDPDGTGTFDPNTDYIAPGTPHDGFSIISDQTGYVQNGNAIGTQGIVATGDVSLLAGVDARGYANAATWTGEVAGMLTVTMSYFFNPGDERVLIETTITALTDLTNLAFNRSVDPDSGAGAPGTFNSINQRGNASFDVNDFIGSESSVNGRTLAIINVNDFGYDTVTSIQSNCCTNFDPNVILANGGGDLGLSSTGDDSLNLAYSIGSLATGSSATFQYAYAAGEGLDDITSPVPEPSTWMMLLLGFFAMGGLLRRQKRNEHSLTVSYS